MTIEDLEIGKIYEVTKEFYSGYNSSDNPELDSVLTSGVLKVGTYMKYITHDDHRSSFFIYGFQFIIDGKIVINNGNDDGVFWFSEEELS